MKIGIVGLPNVGKSTLFNAMTQVQADAENYPFCTIDPNIGVVKVPDERLEVLNEMYEPKKKTPTMIEFVDIAGLVKGASEGEGLGNQFLAHIREVDAIAQVVRCFTNEDIAHVDGELGPKRDIETINTELMLADLTTVEKRLEKAERKAKSGAKEDLKEVEELKKLKNALETGKNIRELQFNDITNNLIKELQLLSAKPIIYVCNINENEINNPEDNKYVKEVKEHAQEEGAGVVKISAEIEADIAELDDEDKELFLDDLGLKQSGLDTLIKEGYDLLDLITFFTAGKKEVRAWTVKVGATAPQAAGVIHTDFERGFIRAEVIKYDDFVHFGSEAKVRDAGKLNVEGKEYVVKDGDIMNFRFNV